MRTDFDNLEDGQVITLHPNADNPLSDKPMEVLYSCGYFYQTSNQADPGPDYYFGDVLKYNFGFTVAE